MHVGTRGRARSCVLAVCMACVSACIHAWRYVCDVNVHVPVRKHEPG